MRKSNPSHLSVPGIETSVLLTVLAILGPPARQALRQVETVFSAFLAQVKKDLWSGGMEWRDALTVADVLPYPQIRPRSVHPVGFAGEVVAIDTKNSRLVVVDAQTKEMRPIEVGANPGQPVVANNRLYVNSALGLHIFDDKWKMRLIPLENALEPVVHGRWVFVPVKKPGRVLILDAAYDHTCVNEIHLDGALEQILVVADKKQLHIPVSTTNGGQVVMVLDIAGYDAKDSGTSFVSPLDTRKFFELLGPKGREALRTVPHFFSKWLFDMQLPGPHGYGWWCDSLDVHFEAVPNMDLNRAIVVGETIYAPDENGLVAYDANKRAVLANAQVNRPCAPEFVAGNICVRCQEGIKVFGPRLNLIGTFTTSDLEMPVAADDLYFFAQPCDPGLIHRATPDGMVDSIKVAPQPGRPVAHNGRLYVPHRGSEYLSVIDVHSFAFLCRIKSSNLADEVRQRLTKTLPQIEVFGCSLSLVSAGDKSRVLILDPGQHDKAVSVIDIPGVALHLLRVNNRVGLNELWVPYSREGKTFVARINLKGWY